MPVNTKEKWKKYLDRVESSEDETYHKYNYPVTDNATNTKLQKQDPDKPTREKTIVSQILDRNWEVAIDFGCGTGAYFRLFDQQGRDNCLLIGIDPDCSRIRLAQAAARKLIRIESRVVCGGIDIPENAPKQLFADLILCAQVLGHVSEERAERILHGFHRISYPNGYCAIAVPVIGERFKDDPTAGSWDGQCDFAHLVDMNRYPGDPDYRTAISLEDFNKYADKPVMGMLPVRSFLLPDFPDLHSLSLPYPLEKLPPTIASFVDDYFTLDRIMLYSIHRDREEAVFPVGDIMIFLRRK